MAFKIFPSLIMSISLIMACKPSSKVPYPNNIATNEDFSDKQALDSLQTELEKVNQRTRDFESKVRERESELAKARENETASSLELDAIKKELEAARAKADEAAEQSKALEEQLKKAQDELKQTKSGSPVIEKAKVSFVFQHNTQFCLDMAADGVNNATNVQLYRCGDSPSQWFDLQRRSNESYHIVRNNYAKGKPDNYQCLHVANSSMNNGANIETYACDGGGSQVFQLIDQGGGIYMLKNLRSGKCLDAQNGGTRDGVNIIQYDCVGNANQKLRLVQR